MPNSNTIESQRLILRLIDLDLLYYFANGNISGANEIAGFTISKNCQLFKLPRVNKRIKLIENDEHQHDWMYRAIINKFNNKMIGYISFHHKPPDPDLTKFNEISYGNAVELGYAIEPEYRRNGFALESVKTIINWANLKYGIKIFILTIGEKNMPSINMAKKMEFINIGKRIDETDGNEYVYRFKIYPPNKSMHQSQPFGYL